jgi:hypothetical protein
VTRVPPADPVDRMIEDVLEAEARTRAPDRLLEGVYARTRHRRQSPRRPWDGLRLPQLPGGPIPLVLATALLVGGLAVVGTAGGGPVPASTPGPSSPSHSGPIPPAALVCANGSGLGGTAPILWVGCPGALQRVDTSVTPPLVGAPIDGLEIPVAGGVGQWAVTAGGIAAVDAMGRAGQRFDVPFATVVAAGANDLWVGTGDQTVLRIDPSTGALTATIDVGAQPRVLIEAGSRIWVVTQEGTLRSWTLSGLQPSAAVEVGADAGRIGANATAVYVLSRGPSGLLTRVGLADGAVTSRELARPGDPRSLGELLVGDDGVWVTRRNTIVRLDPVALVPGEPVTLPAYPVGIVRDGDLAWVTGDGGRLDLVALPGQATSPGNDHANAG